MAKYVKFGIEQARRIGAVVKRVESIPENRPHRYRRRAPMAGAAQGFDAELTDWEEWGDGTARWRYHWRVVRYQAGQEGVLPVDGGLIGDGSDGSEPLAINKMETNNGPADPDDPAAGWMASPTVDFTSPDFPRGMRVLPIGGGVAGGIGKSPVVRMFVGFDEAGGKFYWFHAMNSIGGPCTEAAI